MRRICVIIVSVFLAVLSFSSCNVEKDTNSNVTKNNPPVVITGEFDPYTYTVQSTVIIETKYDTLELGVCYSQTELVPTIENEIVNGGSVDEENNYYLPIVIGKKGNIFYRSYIKVDGKIYYGDSRTFFIKELIPTPVDLGLSVKWSPYNIGASSPFETGNYYAWGEIESKYNFGIETYKLCSGSINAMSKYCTVGIYGLKDGKTHLENEDDAAYINWGDKWRMPTIEEFNELINSCTWTWVSLDGVSGFTVKSNKSGHTNDSIFIIASGIYTHSMNLVKNQSCGYWSSSLDTDIPNTAWSLGGGGSNSSSFTLTQYRYTGQTIRPVCP